MGNATTKREKTMGQAVDEALERHGKQYPESTAYRADVREDENLNVWRVEVSASHFSCVLVYTIDKH